MTALIIVFAVLALLLIFYIFAVKGRTGAADMSGFRKYHYAHRGLHKTGEIPENSFAAFNAALNGGYGVELDVHLTRDGSLIVIHDATLKRTTGVEKLTCEITKDELKNYRLENTTETIPEFKEVLSFFAGKVPLIIELKVDGNNYADLCSSVCEALKDYNGLYCLESFDPRCVLWLKKHRPDLIRGQLTQNFLISRSVMPYIVDLGLTQLLGNIITRPDFVGFRFRDRSNISNKIYRHIWRGNGIYWVITNPEDLQTAMADGYMVIFEDFLP